MCFGPFLALFINYTTLVLHNIISSFTNDHTIHRKPKTKYHLSSPKIIETKPETLCFFVSLSQTITNHTMQVVVVSSAISISEGSALLSSSSASTSYSIKASILRSSKRVSTNPTSNFKGYHALSKLGVRVEKLQTRVLTVRASGDSNDNTAPVAPLEFESSTGQLLSQILQTHPHLLLAAIDQQIENLQTDRNAPKEDAPLKSQNRLLYRRIAQVKEKEKNKALEEIIYCLIVQKFMDNDISMIPPISMSDPSGRADSWPNQEQKLKSCHSPEAFEMIQNHLSLVLGERLVSSLDTLVQIGMLKLGKLYAASIMYGYFLRRVDQRFQLERTMNALPEGFSEDQVVLKDTEPKSPFWDADAWNQIHPDDDDDDFGYGGQNFFDSSESKSDKLKSYVMYLDAETQQRYATIRSKEAVSLIEKQTQALFGRPAIRIEDDGSLNTSKDEFIGISFAGLTMLVLEAAAFGSFLWDAEAYVETKYNFFKA